MRIFQCTACGEQSICTSRTKPRQKCEKCAPKQVSGYVRLRPVKKACAQCRVSFVTTYPHAKYCSDDCYHLSSKRGMSVRWKRVAVHIDRTPAKCGHLYCDNTFIPGLKTRFCSPECRLAERYRLSAGNCHKRRAKKYGCEYEKFDKIDVFNRDGWRCRLCNVVTPRENMGKHVDNAPQLDHIVPMVKGGGHTLTNTQCLCMRCNLTKSDKHESPDRQAA